MTHITFFCCEQMLATSMTLPIEMFRAAENAAQVQSRGNVPLEIVTAGLTPHPIQTAAGFSLNPDHTIDEISHTDILFLPALWRNPKSPLRQDPKLLSWIKSLHEQGTLICSVGIGVSFLAETGLLDHKAATTHWYYFDRFQKDYPKIQLKRQHFIVQTGHLFTAASMNALADLTVYLIQKVYNKLVAMHVERHFSHEVRKAYNSISFVNEYSQHPDEDIVQIQVWLQDNYANDISIKVLAEQFDVSVRTLNRRFKEATGVTPLAYLQTLRIDGAKDLLKNSNLSIHEVARQIGYHDLSHFNRLFKRLMTINPKKYRDMVRAKLFSAQ
ncbi:MAG: transcriptional regulator GlxA family with amidase domain [Oceanicoccus sp.]|jgi:transcriptional regulator GlxA family with amidase domain